MFRPKNRWLYVACIVAILIILGSLWYVALWNSHRYDRDHVEECWCGHIHYHPITSEKEHVEYEN